MFGVKLLGISWMRDADLKSTFQNWLKPNMDPNHAYFFTYDFLEPNMIVTANNDKQYGGQEEQ